MTERGLPIADGAPACPFVAFADERDERASSPDHRHRCYAESKPAPRALAHQEAYCLSSAFPVCPTFQDWARREAARSRADAPRPSTAMDVVTAGSPPRNPPRNWAAPPPWLSRTGRADPLADSLWLGEGSSDSDEAADDDPAEEAPRAGRGLSGSYADRVASDAPAGIPGMDETEAPDEPPVRSAPAAPLTAAAPPNAASVVAHDAWDDEIPGGSPEPTIRRRRERDRGRPSGGQPGIDRRPERHTAAAPEWERAKPLEAYPTIRARRLADLSVPPILVGAVAIALAAAVLFALPGLLGFGNPGAGASPSATIPVRTPLPSLNPTPVPEPTPVTYVVRSGDTLSGIAGRFGISLQELIDANRETVPGPDKLHIGDVLIIPVPLPTELPAASEIPAATN